MDITSTQVKETFASVEGFPTIDPYVIGTTMDILNSKDTTDSEKFQEFATKLGLWRGYNQGRTILKAQLFLTYLGFTLTSQDYARKW